MLVIAGCKRALNTQFEPCVISGRGAARPDPCEGRGVMHRALLSLQHTVKCVGFCPSPTWGCSGQHSPPTVTHCSFSSRMVFCVKELQVPVFKPC